MGLPALSVIVKSAVQGPRPPSTEGMEWGSGVWAKAGVISRRSRRVLIARHYKVQAGAAARNFCATGQPGASVGDLKPVRERRWLGVAEFFVSTKTNDYVQ